MGVYCLWLSLQNLPSKTDCFYDLSACGLPLAVVLAVAGVSFVRVDTMSFPIFGIGHASKTRCYGHLSHALHQIELGMPPTVALLYSRADASGVSSASPSVWSPSTT